MLCLTVLSACSSKPSANSTPDIQVKVTAAPAQVSAWMCRMPDFDVKRYADYPDYVERTRVLLATVNDHNMSVNNINGATLGAASKNLAKDTK
jgi:hypothetical protein